MTLSLFVEQTFNGLQLGMLLFLVAVGVTLVFGVMNLVNLSQGALVMVGGYFFAVAIKATSSWLLAIPIAIAGLAIVAVLIETLVLRRLYARPHIDQVLATFGLLLMFNEGVVMIWGRDPLFVAIPAALSGSVTIMPGVEYPAYRLAVTGIAAALGVALHILVTRSRLGMLIRAGADKREMIQLLGVDIAFLYLIVFCLGAILGGVAGMLLGPIAAVNTGMGDPILILALVCVVIGGLGSIGGAFAAAMVIGMADTFGRVLLPQLLGAGTGQAIANMIVYLVMAAILIWRPTGLASR
jgi:branched-chain amino acid transport system permease protein